MNWFQQNRFLGTFLAILGLATLASLYFVWSEKSSYDDAKTHFDDNANQLNRLQALAPFPNDANLKKMKAQAEDYGGELTKLKESLKGRVLPVVPMAPNEFQAKLRQAVTALNEKARANKTKLPDNFFLGFDEFASALPATAETPVLGQELAQAELLMEILLDARVDAITVFRRVANPAPIAAPTPSGRKPSAAAAPLIERTVIEVAFTYRPGGARRALNQIASSSQQFYIVRTIHVLNDKEKGPPREVPGSNPAATATPAANTALNFIVGNERLTTIARIEMLRFTF